MSAGNRRTTENRGGEGEGGGGGAWWGRSFVPYSIPLHQPGVLQNRQEVLQEAAFLVQ